MLFFNNLCAYEDSVPGTTALFAKPRQSLRKPQKPALFQTGLNAMDRAASAGTARCYCSFSRAA